MCDDAARTLIAVMVHESGILSRLEHRTNTYSPSAHAPWSTCRYGTQARRLGGDSQRQFDQCNLCLQPLIEPLASPAGFLYCKVCIYENLLAQKKALEEQKRAYDAEQTLLAAGASAAASASQAAEIARFERAEAGVAGDGTHTELFSRGTAAAAGSHSREKDTVSRSSNSAASGDDQRRMYVVANSFLSSETACGLLSYFVSIFICPE